LQVIAGKDPKDATCSLRDPESYMRGITPAEDFPSLPLKGRKVVLVKETLGEGIDPSVESALREAAAHMASLGAEVDEIGLPSFELGLPAYYVIALSEASSNLSRYDGVRYGQAASDARDLRELYLSSRAHLGSEVRRRILMGTYALSAGYYDAYYKRAQQVRTLVSREMSCALASADALLLPVSPTTAYRLGEKSRDPLAMYKGDLMTVNVNLAGLPAVTLPCGVHDGLPIGMQIVGKAFGEADLLSLGHIYEQTAGWKDLEPLSSEGM
jgi:aspartyl-tRNA(Asn)/glutamyl-tRNA(Gln) amidotransferase subunit A